MVDDKDSTALRDAYAKLKGDYGLLELELARLQKELRAQKQRTERLDRMNENLRLDKDDLLRIIQRSSVDDHALDRQAHRQLRRTSDAEVNERPHKVISQERAPSVALNGPKTYPDEEGPRSNIDTSREPRRQATVPAQNGLCEPSRSPDDKRALFHPDHQTPAPEHPVPGRIRQEDKFSLAERGYGQLIAECKKLNFEHSGQLAMMLLELPKTRPDATGVATLTDLVDFMDSWNGCLELEFSTRNARFYYRPADPASSALFMDYLDHATDASFEPVGRFHSVRDGRVLVVKGDCTGEVRTLLTKCITEAAPDREIPRAYHSANSNAITTHFDDPVLVIDILKRIFKLRRERQSPLRDLKIYRE